MLPIDMSLFQYGIDTNLLITLLQWIIPIRHLASQTFKLFTPCLTKLSQLIKTVVWELENSESLSVHDIEWKGSLETVDWTIYHSFACREVQVLSANRQHFKVKILKFSQHIIVYFFASQMHKGKRILIDSSKLETLASFCF